MELSNLPPEVLSKIIEFKLGRPEYLKIKHSKTLKRIQNKYKISRLGPKIKRHYKSRKNIYIIEFCIMREGVPFSLKSIDSIIKGEKEELLFFLYEEVEDNLDYKFKFDIEVQIMSRLPYKEYEENEFSYREIYFMNDIDEYVDEDNIDEVLNKAVEEINEDIDEDEDKDSIIGIQAFHFKLGIVEN